MSAISLIKLVSDIVVALVKMVSLNHSAAGNRTKFEVPICNGSNLESVLITINEFKEASQVLDYIEATELLFINFRRCLDGIAREDWSLLTDTMPTNVIADFDNCIAAFTRNYMTADTKQNLINYIKPLKKPRNMSVHDFITRVRTLNVYVAVLPNSDVPGAAATPALSDAEIKDTIFQAMPEAWQRNVLRSNQHVTTSTLKKWKSTSKMNANGPTTRIPTTMTVVNVRTLKFAVLTERMDNMAHVGTTIVATAAGVVVAVVVTIITAAAVAPPAICLALSQAMAITPGQNAIRINAEPTSVPTTKPVVQDAQVAVLRKDAATGTADALPVPPTVPVFHSLPQVLVLMVTTVRRTKPIIMTMIPKTLSVFRVPT